MTPESPLYIRMGAWVNERFPLVNTSLFGVLYLAALLLSRCLLTTGPIVLGLVDLLGFFTTVAFFLMLRVFDEHKDYEEDCHNYPERVLQSGLITLNHLKVVGAIAIAIQMGVSMVLDGGIGVITLTWLVVMVWSCLMAVEFFCGKWLEKRLVLYAVSHMVVVPMALVWLAQMGAGPTTLPLEIGWLLALSFFSGASMEVARKMKAPGDEVDTIASYTKALGVKTAPVVVLVLLVMGTVMLFNLVSLVYKGDMPSYWYAILTAPIIPGVWAVLRFRSAPSARTAKWCEATVALAMLTGYAALLPAIWIERGFEWV
jgi:hypothetical protein